MPQHSSDHENATALDDLIVRYLRHEAAPIQTAVSAPGPVEHHQAPTEKIADPDLACTGRGMMVDCMDDRSAMDHILATETENRTFDFQKFGQKMKDHCLNCDYSRKPGVRYVNARTLASEAQDLAKFGRVMTMLCLISPTGNAAFEADDRSWYRAFDVERWVVKS